MVPVAYLIDIFEGSRLPRLYIYIAIISLYKKKKKKQRKSPIHFFGHIILYGENRPQYQLESISAISTKRKLSTRSIIALGEIGISNFYQSKPVDSC